MANPYWRAAALSTGLLVIVLAIGMVDVLGFGEQAKFARAGSFIRMMRDAGLNQEDRQKQTVGYYEGLLNAGSRVTSMGSLLTGQLNPPIPSATRNIRALRQRDKYDITRDFLYYVPKPNLDVPDYADTGLRLVTNSARMSDREYPVTKPAGTRRIAVIGDSVTRGQGAPFGESFEALLERRLNERPSAGPRFEVLNFAVSGYRITQYVDVGLERAAPYRPDVYLVCLTHLSISGRWGDHLEQLVDDGVDLKYAYLRELAAEARLRANDDPMVTDAKLAPFRTSTIQWAVRAIRDNAARDGAATVVVLVPTVREMSGLREDFAGVAEMLAGLDVPIVDLVDTFAEVEDLDAFRVSPDNVHPNAEGHRRLFSALHGQILADPRLKQIVLGSPVGTEPQ
jgi:lysophospholipase L1-like esterase